MFTGLIEEVGRITRARPLGSQERELEIAAVRVCEDLRPGDSVCVDGVCLTVETVGDGRFSARLMPETALGTTLGKARPGEAVNLERALRLGERLGGHLLLGHVDAVAEVRSVSRQGGARWLEIESPPEVEPYLAPKGSIAVDGVSLTMAALGEGWFAVSLVGATLERTGLGQLKPGDPVNLECDVIAKHVARLLSSPRGAAAEQSREREKVSADRALVELLSDGE